MAKLHFYYSAMNAGKSTTLLQSNYNYRERGMNTLLFTPDIDTRFAAKKITSRIGLEAEATTFNDSTNLFNIAKEQHYQNKLDCVLLDEAQFLTREQVVQLTEVVDNLKIPVLAYGLRTDYRGEPFTGSLYLLAWAESLTEIKTVCHCGKKATHVLRVDPMGNVLREGAQVAIGGNEQYISVCRKHFKEGKFSYDDLLTEQLKHEQA